jgi:hypothetical protein
MPDQDRSDSYSSAGGAAPEPDRADLTREFSGPGPVVSVSAAPPAATPRLNAGRYQLLDEIARGGMGSSTGRTTRRSTATWR